MEVTKELGGVNYVFWGGREGYMSLLNTQLRRELDNLGRFLSMAVDYRNKIGLDAQFLIEPKPKEPTTHQYDSDCAACMAFLKTYGLEKEFKFNIETNHATLAGHSMGHELAYASSYGMLGSVDANRGDELLGWDTDQFPTNIYTTAQVMLAILGQGGLGRGGLNFDAKVRRDSFEPVDLFYAHIGAMDAFAHGLKIAADIRKDGVLKEMTDKRYASWESGIGLQISEGAASFETLEKYMLEKGEVTPNVSGRQELFEAVFNRYIG
jgi:xylose isomerase